ncbi:hypothetical protein A9R05_23055 [Burkholderia sp. KK1]|nr:hypothetical protein A9R05_23055 [Burkholderia sp. KK1]
MSITLSIVAACAAIAACLNVSLISAIEHCASCQLTAFWRIGTATVGGFLFARFIVGTPDALRGPTAPTISARGVIANVGTVHFRVGGKSSFFSFMRGAQLLGMIVCLAAQFVIFHAPLAENSDGHNKTQSIKSHSNRVTT